MAITHYYSFPYQIIIDFHGIRHFCQKEIRIGRNSLMVHGSFQIPLPDSHALPSTFSPNVLSHSAYAT